MILAFTDIHVRKLPDVEISCAEQLREQFVQYARVKLEVHLLTPES